MEASAKIKLMDNLSLEGGYTYTENEDKDTGRQLPYSPGSSVFGKLPASKVRFSSFNISGFIGIKAGFNREAWNWKPVSGTTDDNPNGLTTKLKDFTKLDAGITLHPSGTYNVFIKVENILGEDIENLDDVYTVLDGEPFFRIGLNYKFL